jgi:hypothetical protein
MPRVEMKNEIVTRTDASIEPRNGVARAVKIGGRVLMVIGALWVLKVGASVLLNPLVLLGGAAAGAGVYWLARKSRGTRGGEVAPDVAMDVDSGSEPVRIASPAPASPAEPRSVSEPARESAAEQEARREEALRALKRRIDAETER